MQQGNDFRQIISLFFTDLVNVPHSMIHEVVLPKHRKIKYMVNLSLI